MNSDDPIIKTARVLCHQSRKLCSVTKLRAHGHKDRNELADAPANDRAAVNSDSTPSAPRAAGSRGQTTDCY
eukprot:1847139-Pyramimonas_sp.AAC.1